MVADLMALRFHSLQQVLVAGDLLADDKKGGGYASFQQSVQQDAGGIPPGAVVKGEGHIFGLLHQLLQRLLIQFPQDFLRNLRAAAGGNSILPSAAGRYKQSGKKNGPVSCQLFFHCHSPQRLVCAMERMSIPAAKNGSIMIKVKKGRTGKFPVRPFLSC